jgi:glycosyltransferase involved in cell wall biosynthesis
MRILHITPSISAVHPLVRSLSRLEGIEVRVLTTDAAGVVYRPGYTVTVAPSLMWQLPRQSLWADVVHLTGAYSFPTLPTLAFARLAGTPLVWSAAGALPTGRQPLKLAWGLACRALAGDRCVLHATALADAFASVALLGPMRTCVIPNGVDIPAQMPTRCYKPEGVLRLLYIGRLDAKKALENLFEALALLGDLPLTLKLCGAGTPGYVMSLRLLARQLRISHLLEFTGPVDADRKSAAFRATDVCVLPSHSENLAMALGHGLPVIASRASPWEAVEGRQCGLWRDNDPQSLASAIRRIADMDLQAMGIRGRAWIKCEFSAEAVAARMLELYRTFGGRHARPAEA